MWAAPPACNGLLIHRRRILFILLALRSKSEILSIPYTAQKMKFLIKDFFIKCDTSHCTKKMKFSINDFFSKCEELGHISPPISLYHVPFSKEFDLKKLARFMDFDKFHLPTAAITTLLQLGKREQ